MVMSNQNGTEKTAIKTKPEAVDVDLKVNFSEWTTMEKVFEYRRYSNSADMDGLAQFFATYITKWSLPHDPNDVATYEFKLSPREWSATITAFSVAVGELFQG